VVNVVGPSAAAQSSPSTRRRASLLPEEGQPSIALAMFGEIEDELLASAPRPSG
jgi:hypothetical protein